MEVGGGGDVRSERGRDGEGEGAGVGAGFDWIGLAWSMDW